jgi:hypothetical protein
MRTTAGHVLLGSTPSSFTAPWHLTWPRRPDRLQDTRAPSARPRTCSGDMYTASRPWCTSPRNCAAISQSDPKRQTLVAVAWPWRGRRKRFGAPSWRRAPRSFAGLWALFGRLGAAYIIRRHVVARRHENDN